jgi:hypothetical protein
VVSDLNSIDSIKMAASKALEPTENGVPQPVGTFQFAMHAFIGVALFHP